MLQQTRCSQTQHCAIDTGHLPRLQRLGQPLDVLQAIAGRDFHQHDTGTGQLGLGLRPVTAIRPQPGKIGGDDERTDRAGKAGQPLAALPAFGQIFGQVGIGGRNDVSGELLLVQRGAQCRKAGMDERKGCVQCFHENDYL